MIEYNFISIIDLLTRIIAYYNSIDSIFHFLIDCKANNQFWKSWAKWWHSLTGFNIRDYPHIHESILFAFPGHNDDAIAINYCILYAKHFIYRKKLNNQNMLTIDHLLYLSHLKYILKIEKNICIAKKQIAKFEKFDNIYDNL